MTGEPIRSFDKQTWRWRRRGSTSCAAASWPKPSDRGINPMPGKVAILHHGYIPHYRVPFYEQLARTGGTEYVVFHGDPPSWIGMAEPPFRPLQTKRLPARDDPPPAAARSAWCSRARPAPQRWRPPPPSQNLPAARRSTSRTDRRCRPSSAHRAGLEGFAATAGW